MALCSDFFKESSIRISSSTITPVPTVRATYQCQPCSTAFQCLQCVLHSSAHSACCPPVLGFGFRAPASASTFSERSSNIYKVTGFQKNFPKKTISRNKLKQILFLLSTLLSDLLVSPQWVLPASGQAFRQVSHQTT